MSAQVKAEHRELASHVLKQQFGNWTNDVPLVAQVLADLEAKVEARVRQELAGDAWAVAVLDAWVGALKHRRELYQNKQDNGYLALCFLAVDNEFSDDVDHVCKARGEGPTPGAARLAAARALRSEDETLGPPPPGAKEE